MALELESLEKAVTALNRALEKSDDQALMRSLDPVVQDVIKSGVIQHFEFTYELSWKFMKRWLETNVSPAVADGVTRRELYRHAAESRLIDDVDGWMRNHTARNLTAHSYAPAVAERVYAAAHDFARDAVKLLAVLKARNG